MIPASRGQTPPLRLPGSAPAISAGGSVCVNGVRLTVQDLGADAFGATSTAETRRRSALGNLAPVTGSTSSSP